jgi:predicted DNA-binding protein (MmcQ/YjbR family)
MGNSGKLSAAHAAVEAQFGRAMLAYPGATEDFPWGHRTAKVNGKMFAILSTDEGRLSVTLKLPVSHEAALLFPFAEPTGYGMGKSGWVTSRFAPGEAVPVELLESWLEESYQAVAPKRVSKARAAEVGSRLPAAPKPAAKKKSAAAKHAAAAALPRAPLASAAGKQTVKRALSALTSAGKPAAKKPPVKKPSAPKAKRG